MSTSGNSSSFEYRQVPYTTRVKNQAIADKIQRAENAAAQADREAAADNDRGMRLTGKALGLLGEWESTRERAATAAGRAAEAAAYAAEEKDRAEYLSQVAAADEAAAQRAEQEYISLERAYQREQQEAKNRARAHERKPEVLKNPPAPRLPERPKTPAEPRGPEVLKTPPADQGPEVLKTPPADQGPENLKTPPADQGPIIDAAGPPVVPYEVGTFNELKRRSPTGDQLDIHHVPQAQPAEQVVPGYTYENAPAIALPAEEHGLIPTLKGVFPGTPQDLLTRDIENLRTFTNAPESSIQQLIDLIQRTYPGTF